MTLEDILEWHLVHYPLAQAVDLYKLVHQGVFGPGHLIGDPESARESLERELDSLRTTSPSRSSELEPLDPSGKFIRVNLAPLLGIRGAPERLIEALLAGARLAGDGAEMICRLEAAARWYHSVLPGTGSQIAALAGEARAAGLPRAHHSHLYRQAYSPAYRVVSRETWQG